MTIRNIFRTPINIVQVERRECWIEEGPGVYDFFVHEKKPNRTYGTVTHRTDVRFFRYVYAENGKKPTGHDWVHEYSISDDASGQEIDLACDVLGYR